jgi:hypothetical protein
MKPRAHLPKNLAFATVVSFLVGASSVHCGASANGNGSGAGSPGSGAGAGMNSSTGGSSASSMGSGLGGDIGIDVQTADYSQDQFYQNDPPPTTCDGGGMPPVVTGSPQCPSDKNLPGCICPAVGTTAACWTGLRANRDHGDCMDGTTTCALNSESTLAWGPCVGEVLPVAGTTGAPACHCFSTGHWQVDNTEPCFLTVTDAQGNMTTTAYASTQGNPSTCPYNMTTGVPTVPASWSTDTLTVDCAGSFTLCYTIKAGNGKSPQSTDCVVAQSCTTSYYTTASMPQVFPPLPGWQSTASAAACVQQFLSTGGYGQMSVDGQSSECELVNEVFQQVTYCPTSCNGSDAGMCGSCQAGGGGTF